MKKSFLAAIDGPAGSGKSTVAKLVAKSLNVPYLDTGAMYRAATLSCIRANVDFSNPDAIIETVKKSNIDIKYENQKLSIFLQGENAEKEIRLPVVNENISRVSEIPQVREILVSKQREIAKTGAVVEGRDIGTVVFPEADFKFYLDAAFDIRVTRRYNEMLSKNIAIKKEDVAEDLKKRDESDKGRKHGPLIKANDAVFLDTSLLSIENVVEKIVSYIKK